MSQYKCHIWSQNLGKIAKQQLNKEIVITSFNKDLKTTNEISSLGVLFLIIIWNNTFMKVLNEIA